MALKQVLLGTAVALAASAGGAQAAIETPTGWYLSMAAGANWIPDDKMTWTSIGLGYHTDSYDWRTGYALAAAVGYDFGDHWRAEFEVAYRHNKVKSFCYSTGSCSTSAGAHVWELSQMVNVFYDFRLGGNWSAALGAGIGGNLVVFEPGFNSQEYDDYVFAGQLIAQLAYQLSDRWQLYADYRYVMMEDSNLSGAAVCCAFPLGMEKQDHTLMLGIRFDLQRDEMAPPPRHEEPPPPERPREFIVFFGFNKSNLTAEAQRVVHEAAEAAREYGSATIVVVGHTDTSGSRSYNLRLSLRRAGAVKAGLVDDGITPDMIQTSGKGETELMVQTGDGVKEPQNRRATISLH
ncbi:MAG: OmpA family protein [Alphaproteobacteria bacterium]|nr:OmpA family protein [Alphaproteobacteria bacterium]